MTPPFPQSGVARAPMPRLPSEASQGTGDVCEHSFLDYWSLSPSVCTSFPVHGRKWWNRCHHIQQPDTNLRFWGMYPKPRSLQVRILEIYSPKIFHVFVSRKYNRHCIIEIFQFMYYHLLLRLLYIYKTLVLSIFMSLLMSLLMSVYCTDHEDTNHVRTLFYLFIFSILTPLVPCRPFGGQLNFIN